MRFLFACDMIFDLYNILIHTIKNFKKVLLSAKKLVLMVDYEVVGIGWKKTTSFNYIKVLEKIIIPTV